jgi:hypothetical protein
VDTIPEPGVGAGEGEGAESDILKQDGTGDSMRTAQAQDLLG